MPNMRSNIETPLEPPLSPPHRRRINSSSSSNIEDYHEPHANEPPAAPNFLASNDTLHLNQNTVNTRPISPIPTIPKSPIPQRELTPNDLLAAMREQQIFITNQQSMFQQERDYNRNALREQHNFMAEQQRQLMSLLVNRQTRSDDSPPSSKSSLTGPKVRMADPPYFDGSIKETENFLTSLENIFDSQPASFPTVESKIRYSLTFLTGGASNWRKLLLRDVSDGNFTFSSWKTFEQRFRATFGNPHLVDEARRKLWTIPQGSRNSEDFFLEFEDIKLEANICDDSLIMFLQPALRPSILSEVLRRDPPPTSYAEWKSASLRADHNQRNSAATKTFHQSQIIPPDLPPLSLFALALTPTANPTLPPHLLVPTYLPPQPQWLSLIPINLAPTSINITAKPPTQKIKTAGNVAKKVTSHETVPTTRPTLKYGASSNNVKN